MKRCIIRSIFLQVLLCLLLAANTAAQEFFNDRYGFAVEIPTDRYFPHKPPANGDGRRFEAYNNSGVTVAFYAHYNVFYALSVDAVISLKERSNIVDVEYSPTFYRLCYELDGVRYLTHTMLKGYTVYSAEFVAPIDIFDNYLPDFEKMRASWIIGFEVEHE